MPALDRVTRSGDWLDGNHGVHLMDLAYEEYVARDRDGAATAHVEVYWARLAALDGQDAP